MLSSQKVNTDFHNFFDQQPPHSLKAWGCFQNLGRLSLEFENLSHAPIETPASIQTPICTETLPY